MSRSSFSPSLLILGAIAIAVGLAVGIGMQMSSKAPTLQSGIYLPKPKQLPDFKLTDIHQQAFTPESLKGHWSVLFSGFTHCPDVCPTTMGVLKQVVARLDSDGHPLDVVFISIDPERDTPDALARYVQFFNPKFNAATGPNPELDKLAQQLGMVYAKVPGPTPDSYTMEHFASLIVIDPQAQAVAYLSPPHQVDALVHDFETLMEQRS